MQKYEKPTLTFVGIRNEQPIADTCWGLTVNHNKNMVHYYDIPGEGTVSFRVVSAGGSCDAPDAYEINYLDANGVPAEWPEHLSASMAESILESALTKAGGGNGQPYSGLNADFPVTPVPDKS